MRLSELQQKFVRMVVQDLIPMAWLLGYEVTFGDAYRDPRVHGEVGEKKGYGRSKSLHKSKLAIDLNLFANGRYLSDTSDHKRLGEYWESIGGTWGGRFGESSPGKGDGHDGNHYSLEYQGRK